jgi:hypothetical protein
MKKTITKSVGALLILLMLLSTLTGCVYDDNVTYVSGAYYEPYEWGKGDIPCAKIESDKTRFDIDSVTLDFYYALYSRKHGESLDELKRNYSYVPSGNDNACYTESEYAIYINNNEELIFEKNENGTLADYKQKVNGIMWKFISFEEAFGTDYGYTTTVDENSFFKSEKVNYSQKETITIPKELFNSSSGYIYIHVVRLLHNKETDQHSRCNYYCYTFEVKYQVILDTVKLDLAKT